MSQMKCRRCPEKAVIHMRQHKLALCAEHYLEWVPEQVARAIHKYKMFTPADRVLVAVSGGKDSLSLWDILIRLGYAADGLYIGLGITYPPTPFPKREGGTPPPASGGGRGVGSSGYSAESHRLCVEFAQSHGLTLHTVDVPEVYGESIPVMARRAERGRGKPCSVCGLTKRHEMNRIAHAGGYSVLATGHNLDDEAAVLLGNTLNWLGPHLVRQAPVLEANQPGLARKVKPLVRMYEREMAAYAVLRGIEYIYEECPYAGGSRSLYYKEILNKMELDRPGAKLSFYLNFLQAKDNGLFGEQADPAAALLHTCSTCGQPTSAPGSCSFCRMTRRD